MIDADDNVQTDALVEQAYLRRLEAWTACRENFSLLHDAGRQYADGLITRGEFEKALSAARDYLKNDCKTAPKA